MSILDRVQQDYTQALKDKETTKVDILRVVISSLKNAQIQKGQDKSMTDDEQMKIVQTEVKKLKDAVDQYTKAGRDDLAKTEKTQLDIVMAYMPEQLSDEDLKAIVGEVIKETGAENMSQMGMVMGAAMSKVSGKADGNAVKEIVMELLG